ncbi:hypothetical protein DYBT9275_00242 [Dyadobacter sp. CECT 9275]|uniref:Uncharacterized protein n=1 Tax=Dyadobacter helix TaxID=2822344 RepID=A0A916N407_9BACT|nr:hypothetical protein [Dyadobacter sp. CECT 9275]CAG4989196.1 hypothetical protein DYBT9275_00242 [Dyadobacter sp. CECT 9275]
MGIFSVLRATLLLLVSFLLVLANTGCDSGSGKNEKLDKYYDLQGFIQKQVTLLKAAKPTVNKQVSLNGEQEKLVSREVNWEKELELFMQADLNKPAYAQSYAVKKDSLHIAYTLISGENLLVKKLIIRLDSISKSPVLIEGELESSNKLYQSYKKIRMICSQGKITSYSIEGYQKLALMDAQPFSVQVKIGHY